MLQNIIQLLTILLAIYGAVGGACRTIQATTVTPPQNTFMGKVYMVIEFIGITSKYTKMFAPDSTKGTTILKDTK